MLLIRPVTENDLDGVYLLAKKTGGGLTTLPADKPRLLEKIRESVKNFDYRPSRPNGETFFFVLEDTTTNKLVGTSAVYSKVGGFQPFWTYELKTTVKKSVSLKVNKEVQYLQVKREHNGPSEVGTLFLDSDFRRGNNGRLLSLSRFLFVAENRDIFEDQFVAELRGRIDKNGNSVFWDCLGAHFFDVPFEKADLMVNEDKSFIDDLMPQHPIYVDLLPKEAQLVIGCVHDDTRPAMRLLEKEGFQQIDEVDIFEAGPILEVDTDSIRCVRSSLKVSLSKEILEESSEDVKTFFMVANVTNYKSYKVVVSEILILADGKISLPKGVVSELELKVGDAVRYVAIR
jgi:arginine N-succinyltransferase